VIGNTRHDLKICRQGSNKMMFYADPTNYGKPRKMDLLLSRQMLFVSEAQAGWRALPAVLSRKKDKRVLYVYTYDALSSVGWLLLLVLAVLAKDNTYEWIATQGWSFLPLDSCAYF